MGRVTFEGPIKSNAGIEIGSTGSRSNVAGTVVVSTAGSITIHAGTANLTTVSISGNESVTGDVAITGDLSVTASTTVGTISIAAATNNAIQIGSTVTGWGSGTYHTLSLTPGATVSMNCNSHSVFYISNTSSSGYKVMPVGGFVGQTITIVWNVGTSTSIVFASSSSVCMRMSGNVTGWAGLAGSLQSIAFLNVGPGRETPTSSTLLIDIARNTDYTNVL